MTNPSAAVLDRQAASGCGCFTHRPPMPMGCAACGHPPYAHGCNQATPGHGYAQPSSALIAERLRVRHQLGLGRVLPVYGPPAVVAPYEVIPLVPTQRRPAPPAVTTPAPVPAAVPLPAPTAVPLPVPGTTAASAPATASAPAPVVPPAPPPVSPATPALPVPVPVPVPRPTPRPVRHPEPALRPAATAPPRRHDSRRPAPHRTRVTVRGPRPEGTAAPPCRAPVFCGAPLMPSAPHLSRVRPDVTSAGRTPDRTSEVRSMHHPKTATPAPAIPGWRVIRSDAGRYWASREEPFPDDTAWNSPPFRTVDADTFDDLQAEVTRQEEAAQESTTPETAGEGTW
ncbi:hypothetical protein [Streptosporangium sp. NPDC087985]|uniref:hypothetical protein n=1 Tax=Streptosporangium sp. NPDC087985 TaxID=3366196 RepID=UPI003806F2A6